MSEQLNLEQELGWVEDKPEFTLVWRGLSISISRGFMTYKEADEMIQLWENDAFSNVFPIRTDPPDLAA